MSDVGRNQVNESYHDVSRVHVLSLRLRFHAPTKMRLLYRLRYGASFSGIMDRARAGSRTRLHSAEFTLPALLRAVAAPTETHCADIATYCYLISLDVSDVSPPRLLSTKWPWMKVALSRL